jgi:hypothetical protein
MQTILKWVNDASFINACYFIFTHDSKYGIMYAILLCEFFACFLQLVLSISLLLLDNRIHLKLINLWDSMRSTLHNSEIFGTILVIELSVFFQVELQGERLMNQLILNNDLYNHIFYSNWDTPNSEVPLKYFKLIH